MKQTEKDLTLLLLFLTSSKEESRKKPGTMLLRAWKGYPFELLNALQAEGLILQHKESKKVTITGEGKEKAEKLKAKYLKTGSRSGK